jgi:transcriptional regulator with XRE-family HTH domain
MNLPTDLEILLQRRRIATAISDLHERGYRSSFVRQNVLVHFRKQLKAMRKDFGYTQKTMSLILNISVSRYSAIERIGELSMATIAKLADTLNCAVEVTMVPFSTLVEHINQKTAATVVSFPLEHSGCEHELAWINLQLDKLKDKALAEGQMAQPVGKSTRKKMTEAQLSRYRIDENAK